MKLDFVGYKKIGALSLALSTLSMSAIAAHVTHAQKMHPQMSHLRGERYCEIILSRAFASYSVYSTVGLNHCPKNVWDKVTVTEVKKETHASRVFLNGPRYWVIDGLENSAFIDPTPKTIAGLTTREAGILRVNPFGFFGSARPYQDKTVDRQTTWIYKAGRPVYELVSPQGRVYVMQSFTSQKQMQSLRTLKNLGKTLTLPSGWQFKSGILKHTETLTAMQNRAIVIQDSNMDTYQLAPHDFLK